MTVRGIAGITRVLSGGVGEALKSEGLALSPRDRGFTLGDGIFETILVHRGVPFMLAEHLERLSRSADALGIPLPGGIRDGIDGVLADGIDAANVEQGFALRLTLSRGIQTGAGLALNETPVPTLVASLIPLNGSGFGTHTQPLDVVFAAGRRNERSASVGHKITGYADAIIELRRARLNAERDGARADDCVFLDTAGHVSEAAASNVFIHDGDALATPPLECGALPGITRGVILSIAAEIGVRAEERVIEPEELRLAREAFLTSSLRGVAPVARIAGDRIGPAAPGPITLELLARYSEVVQANCAAAGASKPGS